jgi:hypothetical protein
MNRHGTLTFATVALLSLAVSLPAGHAIAQEKQHVPFKPDSANPKVEITVTFAQVGTSARGNPWRQDCRRTYLLAGNHMLRSSLTISGLQHDNSLRSLGTSAEGPNVFGLNTRTTAHIVGGALVEASDTATYVITETIKTDGRTSCSFTKEWKLKPGHQFFDFGSGHLSS